MESRTPGSESSNKRPRSPAEYPQIASKAPRVQSNHLQINYLARQYTEDLPLVSPDDNMSGILHLIGEYDGVLQRHESIAGNLGACPLGPILIKRFERLFDGPPRVLKSNAKETPSITWLDVVEFARSKPEQFNLERTRNGVRVCQFYTKQCRVEISEEDYVLIASGMPQKMIPPQPIIEDEEKELGSLEILEKNMQSIIQAADQVSARARQLNHRLKNRRIAIITRRENDVSLHSRQAQSLSPTLRDSNGHVQALLNGNVPPPSHSPTGFVAVNANRPGGEPPKDDAQLPTQFPFPHSNTDNVTIINGASIKGASPTTRAELMKKFFTTDRQARGLEEPTGQASRQTSRPKPKASDSVDYTMYQPPPATVAIPNTPSSLLPPPKSSNEKDDGGPYKMHMIARMEELQRGDRVMPPCDRCRRLHMDCVKNLTACIGCTKKHCKCAWKDVKEEEIRELEAQKMAQDRASDPQRADAMNTQSPPAAPVPPVPSVPEHGRPRQEFTPHQEYRSDSNWAFDVRRESAPVSSQAFGPRLTHDVSPRRAVSEVRGSAAPNNDTRLNQAPASTEQTDDDDPGANQRLMQAILDTVDHHARAASTKESGNEVSGDENKGQMVRA